MIAYIFKMFKKDALDQDLLRFAKREYSRDWQYAYHMLSNGKTPFGENQ